MSSFLRVWRLGAFAAAGAALFFGCSGGTSSSGVGLKGSGGAFYVVDTVPKNQGTVFLNQPIAVEFTQEVDLTTVSLNSFSFTARDPSKGTPLGETVVGEFRYKVENGVVNRRIVEFLPKFPTNNFYDNGGFKPGRRYDVEITGGAVRGAPIIRSLTGQDLQAGASFTFFTPKGTTPQELFMDVKPGGPNKVALSPDGNAVKVDLNFFLHPNDPIRLVFNQPINPASNNFNTDRIYLEYYDPDPTYANPPRMTRIPVKLKLVANLPTRAEVAMTPIGVLPSNAEIHVIVEASFEDISGESNVADPAYKRIFGFFPTKSASTFQYDALVEDFQDRSRMDLEAAFPEPLADWKDGRLRASFDFGGTMTLFDYEPQKDVVLNTDFTQVVPKQGIPFTVSGGVFQFHDIVIPAGVTVRGEGHNPLVFLASGNVLVEGTISANGGNGTIVDTVKGADTPVPGGKGVCGGGSGGSGSPMRTDSSPKGEDGYGPGGVAGGGGKGGHTGFGPAEPVTGAGGGGGSMATLGDPTVSSPGDIEKGRGGAGKGTDAILGKNAPLGGNPGVVVFKDKDPDNNFYGRDVRLVNGKMTVINGELQSPVAGQGGGGGGDKVLGNYPSGPAGFFNNEKGGGGGGGAGVIIIKAIGTITVSSTGRISADGGNGGGGELNGNCSSGGGGGGGSGGMVILNSSTKIILKQKVSGFSVTADGGIGSNGLGQTGFWSKYMPAKKKASNRGGYGGLGIVELLAPDPTKDIIYTPGQVKPEPIKLPSTFGALSRARSKWIYMGAVQRQNTNTNNPRYLNNGSEPGKFGPEYRFAGIHTQGVEAGYVDYRTKVTPNGAEGWVNFSTLAKAVIRNAVPAGAGVSFHEVKTTQAVLGETNSLRGARARIVDAGGGVKGEWLVIGNTANQLFLDPATGPAFSLNFAGLQVEVINKYFDLWTSGKPGLPLLVENQKAQPTANVRIGFAACRGFDKDGNPIDRYPATGFTYDLETLQGREAMWKDSKGGYLARPYLMFDVLFNLSYNPENPLVPRNKTGVSPESPLPELRYLVIPYRF